MEPLRVRVDRNRVRYVVFLATFVIGSAALLTLAFVSVPGSLIGLAVSEPDYYSWLGVVVAGVFALFLVVGSIAAHVQVANAEQWVRSRFQGVDLDAGTYIRLHEAVEEISLGAGLHEPPRLMLLGVSSVNACAIGAGRRRPIIGVTRGFLDSLTAKEQQAVIATLVARITRGDILVATALAALMGPLRRFRDTGILANGVGFTAEVGVKVATKQDNPRGCLAGLALTLVVIVVVTLYWAVIAAAAWLVGIWGRMLHRTGHEKADAEGMLLLRDPQPMLSALAKAISSSNVIADGDPSYDGIFYAATSGKPMIEKVERRRYDRLREVLGTEGLATPINETGPEAGDEASAAQQTGGVKRLIDHLGKQSVFRMVPPETFEAGTRAAKARPVKTLDWDVDGLRTAVGAEGYETRLWVEAGELRWSCTCGCPGDTPCEHVVASAAATWPAAEAPAGSPVPDAGTRLMGGLAHVVVVVAKVLLYAFVAAMLLGMMAGSIWLLVDGDENGVLGLIVTLFLAGWVIWDERKKRAKKSGAPTKRRPSIPS